MTDAPERIWAFGWQDDGTPEGAMEYITIAASDARVDAARSPQCCMCGKLGLSTVEGDGGPECELYDGRWVCSNKCYDAAVEPDARVEAAVRAVITPQQAAQTLITYLEEIQECHIWGVVEDAMAVPMADPGDVVLAALRALAADPDAVARIAKGARHD